MALSTQLPDDTEALKLRLAGREALIVQLTAEIARLKRWRYGRSAETLDESVCPQLAFNQTTAPAAPQDVTSVSPEDSTRGPARARTDVPRRPARAFPAELPRETVVHQPASCQCPECGSSLRRLGEDVSEMLDFVPGHFQVIRHVRPKMSCAQCSNIVQMPAPSRPIKRGMPSASLLAQVIVGKYRSLSTEPPAGDLSTRWRGAGPRNACFVGGRKLRVTRPTRFLHRQR